mgnify:CR=1 FL=1
MEGAIDPSLSLDDLSQDRSMPSTLVLNADLDVCPALGTWIVNNTQLLSGFSLLIGDDVLQELARRHDFKDLSIIRGRAIRNGGDIVMAATILNGEISGLIHFPSPPEQHASDVLSDPLVRAALLSDLPIALNPATASALMQGVKRSRRGYLIFNSVSGQGDPDQRGRLGQGAADARRRGDHRRQVRLRHARRRLQAHDAARLVANALLPPI